MSNQDLLIEWWRRLKSSVRRLERLSEHSPCCPGPLRKRIEPGCAIDLTLFEQNDPNLKNRNKNKRKNYYVAGKVRYDEMPKYKELPVDLEICNGRNKCQCECKCPKKKIRRKCKCGQVIEKPPTKRFIPGVRRAPKPKTIRTKYAPAFRRTISPKEFEDDFPIRERYAPGYTRRNLAYSTNPPEDLEPELASTTYRRNAPGYKRRNQAYSRHPARELEDEDDFSTGKKYAPAQKRRKQAYETIPPEQLEHERAFAPGYRERKPAYAKFPPKESEREGASTTGRIYRSEYKKRKSAYEPISPEDLEQEDDYISDRTYAPAYKVEQKDDSRVGRKYARGFERRNLARHPPGEDINRRYTPRYERSPAHATITGEEFEEEDGSTINRGYRSRYEGRNLVHAGKPEELEREDGSTVSRRHVPAYRIRSRAHVKNLLQVLEQEDDSTIGSAHDLEYEGEWKQDTVSISSRKYAPSYKRNKPAAAAITTNEFDHEDDSIGSAHDLEYEETNLTHTTNPQDTVSISSRKYAPSFKRNKPATATITTNESHQDDDFTTDRRYSPVYSKREFSNVITPPKELVQDDTTIKGRRYSPDYRKREISNVITPPKELVQDDTTTTGRRYSPEYRKREFSNVITPPKELVQDDTTTTGRRYSPQYNKSERIWAPAYKKSNEKLNKDPIPVEHVKKKRKYKIDYINTTRRRKDDDEELKQKKKHHANKVKFSEKNTYRAEIPKSSHPYEELKPFRYQKNTLLKGYHDTPEIDERIITSVPRYLLDDSSHLRKFKTRIEFPHENVNFSREDQDFEDLDFDADE